MVKTEDNTLKEKKELVEGQFLCPDPNCGSKKIQAIRLASLDGETTLTLLCLVCGTLYPFYITGSIVEDDGVVAPIKSPPGYTA